MGIFEVSLIAKW